MARFLHTFFRNDDHGWEDLGGGLKRKIIGYTDDLMAVYIEFEKGAVGEPHYHEIHDQIGYVAEGSFEAEIDGEKAILKKGDAYIARKHFVHGAVALEEGSALIDMFSPLREDFIEQTDV